MYYCCSFFCFRMSNTEYTEDIFKCWVPATVVKGQGKDAGRRWLQGIASTSATDLQGESVSQLGIDTDYFMRFGYFNDDHKQGNEYRVGQPTDCKVTKDGLWVKGFLFDKNEKADGIWKLMESLEASKSDRKMGFSIEGKVRKRNGSKIEKCWIQNVAITAQPVNTHTWAEIVKSLTSSIKEDDQNKALATGGDNPLVPESLETKEKDQMGKSLTLEQTVEYLQVEKGLSKDNAESTARVIFASLGL